METAGEFAGCSAGLSPAKERAKKDGWVGLVADTVLKEIWPGQRTALKPELPVSYAPAAVDSTGTFSWLPQRGCPECKLGKEKPFRGKKSQSHMSGAS